MNVKIFAKHLFILFIFFYLINDHMYLNNIWGGGVNSIIKKVAILKAVALLSSK